MDIYHNILRHFDEADMGSMKREDWLMFRLSHICRNEASLFHDLMRVENPTLSKIVEAGLAWENANKSREMAVPRATYNITEDKNEEQILAIPEGGCGNCGLFHVQPEKCSAID